MLEGVAAVLEDFGQAVRLTEVVAPTPAPGEVLVRMVAARVGDADRALWRGAVEERLPMVLGREGSGVVEALGSGVARLREGDHVVVVADGAVGASSAHGRWAHTRPLGTYATYVTVPARQVARVDPCLPLRSVAEAGGATLAGYAAVARVESRMRGATVLVLELGEVGQAVLVRALAWSTSRVIAVDRRPDRLAWARSLGAEAIAADVQDVARAVGQVTGGRGADCAFVTGSLGGGDGATDPRALVRTGGMVVAVPRHPDGKRSVADRWQAGADGPGGDLEGLIARFARDRFAVRAFAGAVEDMEDLSDLLGGQGDVGLPAPLLWLSFDMP